MRLTGLDAFADLTLAHQDGEILVLRAHDPDGRSLVIKTHASNLPTEALRSLLDREFRATSSVDSPHLLDAVQLIDQPNRTALVLADPGQRTLRTELEAGHLDLDLLLAIAGDIAKALGGLHAAGLVHRAVDAEHIALDDEGQAVLVDLSSAWPDGGTPPLPSTGAHPAPEQLGRGSAPVTSASDQFALVATVADACARAGLDIPDALAAVIERATDPDPRQRYRSVIGLHHDLDRIRYAVAAGHDLDGFAPEVECPRLLWQDPDMVIGRDAPLARIHGFVNEVKADGLARVLVLRAEPGMGRTTLVSALCDQLAEAAVVSGLGQFVKGGPTMPVQAPIEMMEQVVSLLLAAPDDTVEQLRSDLESGLGADLGLLAAIIPSLSDLVGEQPAPTATPPEEAIDRIEGAVRTMVSAIANTVPPLVTVFDDADRADRSSLRIFEVLARSSDVGPLSVILTASKGSRRLDATLDRIRRRGVEVQEVNLEPLPAEAIAELIARGTGASRDEVATLGNAVWTRSGGSPTVALADIWSLLGDGHLRVEPDTGRWIWDDDAMAMSEPDDLDTVSSRRFDQLDPELRPVIVAAAIASRAASVEVLAAWSGRTPEDTSSLIDRAVSAHFLVRRTDPQTNNAQTDNAQTDHAQTSKVLVADNATRRAATDLLDPGERDELRRAVALAVIETLPQGPDGVEVVDDETRLVLLELLREQPLLDDDAVVRTLYQRLCQEAARDAHRNAAFQESLELQLEALSLLRPGSWRSDPDTTFELHLRAAEHATILGRSSLVDDLLDRMNITELPLDQRVRTLTILGTRAWTRGDARSGLNSLRAVLAELGEPLPATVGWPDIAREYVAVRRALARRRPEDFLSAPRLDDERVKAAFEAMLACVHLAYVTQPMTHILLVLRGTRLTAQYGVGDASAYFLTGYGMLNVSIPSGIGTGLRFGAVGRELSTNAVEGVGSMVAFAHDAFVRHWGEPLGSTIEPLTDAFRTSLARGRRYYGLTGGAFAPLHGLLASRPLHHLDEQAAEISHDFATLDEPHFRVRVEIVRQAVDDLRDGPSGSILAGDHFHADDWLAERTRHGELSMIVHTLRGLVAMCLGDLTTLRRSTAAARGLVRTAPGQAVLGRHWFHEAYLDALDVGRATTRRERVLSRARAERSLRRLRELAEHAPDNVSHRVAFVEAILAEHRSGAGAAARAMDRFERSVSQATANGALHDLGVMAERAASFHGSRDRLALGRHYGGVAADTWAAWGATGVGDTISERLAPSLLLRSGLGSEFDLEPAGDPGGPLGDATSDTLAEASSLLGQELEVREFLERLIEILMRHTEATRGWLILQTNTGTVVEVAGRIVGDRVELGPLVPSSVDSHEDLCRPAVNYVLRTRQVLSVVDPASDRRLRADEALRRRAPRALLGLPVGHSGTTAGALVLESDTYTHAFEPERIEALRVLSAQAISAIDQARLRSDLTILSDDVAELRATASVLTTKAETDALTGIANRAGMETRLHAAIRVANSPGQRRADLADAQVGVLFCDLDDFKAVNDHFGHAVGDAVLVEIADRLASVTRADDIVARIGGDEFVVVSVGVSTEELEQMADRALSQIAQAIEVEHHGVVAASVSIGIGRADLGTVTSIDDVDALVRVADQAMYEAKHSGKNQINKGVD